MSEAGFGRGVKLRAVTPGWDWIIHDTDGSAITGWAPTREQAIAAAVKYETGVRDDE